MEGLVAVCAVALSTQPRPYPLHVCACAGAVEAQERADQREARCIALTADMRGLEELYGNQFKVRFVGWQASERGRGGVKGARRRGWVKSVQQT